MPERLVGAIVASFGRKGWYKLAWRFRGCGD